MSRHLAGIFFLLTLLTPIEILAQRFGSNAKTPRGSIYTINKKYTNVGVSVNAMNYFGDLAPTEDMFSTELSLTRAGFGIFAARRLGPRFSARASLSWGRIKGDDFEAADTNDELARFRYVRNLQFRNDIKELSVVGIIDFVENLSTHRSRKECGALCICWSCGFSSQPSSTSSGCGRQQWKCTLSQCRRMGRPGSFAYGGSVL